MRNRLYETNFKAQVNKINGNSVIYFEIGTYSYHKCTLENKYIEMIKKPRLIFQQLEI